MSDILLQLAPSMEVLTAVLAVLILVSSLDDLFFDVRYWWRRLLRRRSGQPVPAISPDELGRLHQQPMVIMVPAWQEADVIGDMLRNTLRTVEYTDYMVFVGTYVNDPATRAAVDAVARTDSRVRRVEIPHPGPTRKADCLNHVVQAVLDHERTTRRPFSALVLHDAEDVLHPLELQYFNALAPHHDMVQLPVVAIERPWTDMVSGTYADEFAEAHGKDILVRQHLAGNVPSAGVGTCFSRAAMLALWRQSDGEPFSTRSLTEDYEVGMHLCAMGMRTRFATLQITDDPRTWQARRVPAVREYFPRGFRAACRQKARWMLGIGLQAWSLLPLRGLPWPVRYVMLHDRKSALTAFVPAAAYVVVAYALVHYAGFRAGTWAAYEPAVFRPGSPWMAVLYANLGLLLLRAAQRVYFTGRIYGWRQGVAALPRMVVGNVVNCFAAARAWRLYLEHRITGRPLAWEKTDHEFPSILTVPQPMVPQPTLPQPILTAPPARPASLHPSVAGGVVAALRASLQRHGAGRGTVHARHRD